MITNILQRENGVTIVQGSSKTLKVRITTGGSTTGDCTPVDLTGARVIMTVRSSCEGSHPLFTKDSNVSGQIDIPDPRSGVALINIQPIDTQSAADGDSFLFDVWVILSSGKRYPVIPPSPFEITCGVTVFAS